MATRSRIRSRFDIGRIMQAAQAPGNDPRTWVQLARVDDDPDAVRWDAELGWIVDVTCVGGPLDGEGPVAARVAGPQVGPSEGASAPVAAASLVVLVLTEGDLNAQPVIVGALWTPDVKAPASVGGADVDEDFAEKTWFVSVDKDIVLEARERAASVLGQDIKLAEPDASESFVKGDAQKDALTDFLDALTRWNTAIANGVTSAGGAIDPLAITAIETAISTLKTGLEQALSSRIKGA